MGSLERHKLVGMDGDDSCSSCHCETGQASSERLNTLILDRSDPRLRRMTPFVIIVALLLLISGILVFLVIGLGGQCYPSPDSKTEKQTDYSSPGVQQETLSPQYQHPSAMLTVNNTGRDLQWVSDIGYAYCHGGFIYSNGNLVVPRKGTYRVFLQITYEINGDEDSETERKSWNKGPEMKLLNNVYVYSDSYPSDRLLLSSIDTVQRRGQSLDKSMYTSGMFLLEANDRLHVTSSHPELIAKNEHQVFFGAELLQ